MKIGEISSYRSYSSTFISQANATTSAGEMLLSEFGVAIISYRDTIYRHLLVNVPGSIGVVSLSIDSSLNCVTALSLDVPTVNFNISKASVYVLVQITFEVKSRLQNLDIFSQNSASSFNILSLSGLSGSRFSLNIDGIDLSISDESLIAPNTMELNVKSFGIKTEIKHDSVWSAFHIDAILATSSLCSMV